MQFSKASKKLLQTKRFHVFSIALLSGVVDEMERVIWLEDQE